MWLDIKSTASLSEIDSSPIQLDWENINLSSDDQNMYLKAGILNAERGKFKEALSAFNKALDIN